MKKTALLVTALMLATAFLNAGFICPAPMALAEGSDVLSLSAPFKQALINAHVDVNADGNITKDEMAAPSSLDISGSQITDISGIEYATGLKSLAISGTGITGLPAAFSNLAKLTSLDISYNDNLSVFPDQICGLTSLTTLHFYKNKNVQSVSADIGKLTKLTDLNLFANNLTALPDAIGELTNLTGLNLQQNQLSALPDSLSKLTKLTELTIWDNCLTALPAGVFGGMTALTELDLSNNYFNPNKLPGGIPHTATVSPQKTYAVSLKYNGGAGDGLPNQPYYYGDTVKLPVASKTGFVFSGWDADGDGKPDKQPGDTVAIVPSPANVSAVDFYAVYGYTVTFRAQPYGKIGGDTADVVVCVNDGKEVPAASIPAASADTGYVSLGWYDGESPVTADDIAKMQINANKIFTACFEAEGTIHFHDTAFKAALTAAGADENGDGFITETEMGRQKTLTLSGGQFTDIREIGYATSLTSLTLGAGQVSALPGELGNLTALTSLDISGNPVASLPVEIGNLIHLETLNMANTGMASLPGDIQGFDTLKTLDASGNGMTALPSWLHLMTGLETLDVHGNKFAAFPAELESMAGVKALDISDNLLIGLPSGCFTGMSALTALNLRNNYFNPDSMPAGVPAYATVKPQKTYAITLNLNGGATDNPLPKPGYWYGEQIPLPMAQKDGYVFTGWDINGDGAADTAGACFDALTPNPPDSISSKTYTAVYKSSNAYLSGIGLSAGGYLSPAFSHDVTEYTVTLYDYQGSITVTPQKADAHASMKIGGAAVASDTVSLASSADTGTRQVDLTAEDGVTTQSYTIHFVRAAHVDLGLSGISLTPGLSLAPGFSPSVTNYTVLLPISCDSVTVGGAQADPLAQVSVNGTGNSAAAVPVAPGESKAVPVTVSSPLTTDRTNVYTVTLQRCPALSSFDAFPKTGSTPTLSPYGSNRITFSYTMAGSGTVKIEVYKSKKWYTILTRTEVSAGSKTWDWDGKVSGKTLSRGTYKVRITPTAYGMTGGSYTINVKIVSAPSVSWKTYAKKFKATGTPAALCTFKVNYPTNAVVQVCNSKGRSVAVLATYTNLPASAYTAIVWDGTARPGNAAGLASGSLVPAGTYTVRVTVGTKTSSKTVKVSR